MNNLLFIAIGGAGGSILRYYFQRAFVAFSFPYGTLAVNIVGCFLIGVFWGLTMKNFLSEQMRLLLMVGFCGGFTTFSSFTYESMQLLMQNRWLSFLAYAGISVVVGIFATFIGFRITST